MTEIQQSILELLENRAVGRNNVIKQHDIAQILSIPPYGTNDDNVRGYIRDMVIIYRCPIGTCNRGVFLITNEQERGIAIKYIGDKNPDRVEILRQVPLYTPNNRQNRNNG